MATDPALAPWFGCRRFSGAARQRGSWGTRGEEAGPVAGLGACTPSPRCLARGTSTRENDGGRLEREPIQHSLGTRRQRRFQELAGRRVPSIDGSGHRHCLVGRSGRLEPRPQQWPRATRLGGKGLDRVARATSTPRGECPSVVQLSGGGEPLFSRLLTRPAFPFGPGAAEVVTAAAPTVDRAHSHRHRHLGMPEAGFRGLDRAQRRPRAVGLETPEFQKQRGSRPGPSPCRGVSATLGAPSSGLSDVSAAAPCVTGVLRPLSPCSGGFGTQDPAGQQTASGVSAAAGCGPSSGSPCTEASCPPATHR